MRVQTLKKILASVIVPQFSVTLVSMNQFWYPRSAGVNWLTLLLLLLWLSHMSAAKRNFLCIAIKATAFILKFLCFDNILTFHYLHYKIAQTQCNVGIQTKQYFYGMSRLVLNVRQGHSEVRTQHSLKMQMLD